MSRVHERGPARIGANMTPMVDVVFLLIIFFVLVAQITSSERLELELPSLAEEGLAETPRGQRLVINIAPDGRRRFASDDYSAGAAGLTDLGAALRAALRREPNSEVLVRAAGAASYEQVQPVLRLCSETGVRRVHIVASPERERQRD